MGDLVVRDQRLVDQAAENIGSDLAKKWSTLSEETVRAAMGTDPTENNTGLRKQAELEPESPIAPGLFLWEADALARSGRHSEAAESYDRLIDHADGVSTFGDVDIVGEAMRHKAASLAHLGDVDGAIAAYRDAANAVDPSLLYRAGLVAERALRFDDAVSLYDEIASKKLGPNAGNRSQRALRARNRLLDERGVYKPSLMGIVTLVEAAVVNRDNRLLERLASPTHFLAGPGGGHFQFEGSEVLDWLCRDLGRSRPRRMGGVVGTGRKRYLFTSGWRGQYFEGVVGFVFIESGRGWEWAGLVVSGPAPVWKAKWEPDEKMTNQPLPFPLLAPWPSGRRFMAGGLGQFAAKSAAVVAALFIPFAGPAVSAGLALGFSAGSCGYGTRGFYYDEGPTHDGRDAFAIDFTTYRRGIPFDNESGGTPVLCTADGVVRMVDDDVASGDDSDANEVQVDHVDPATGANRFVSRYMHMTGPFAIPVSAGMAAPAGRRLGVMNDTGTSLLDHLHFSVHDSTTGAGIGNSVRPTPLDGTTLGDDDSGTCVESSNTETIVITLPPGCGTLFTRLVREAFGGRREP